MNKKKIESLKSCTGIIIRFDDIAPNMNWLMMDRCEKLLNKFNIKPVLGIIPNNKDQELLSYPKRENFWKIVQNWKSQNGLLQCMVILMFMITKQIKKTILIMEANLNFLVTP